MRLQAAAKTMFLVAMFLVMSGCGGGGGGGGNSAPAPGSTTGTWDSSTWDSTATWGT